MSIEHHVIIGPGLDNRTWPIKFVTRNWPEKYDLIPDVLSINWKDGEGFVPKLEIFINAIDQHVKLEHEVYLMGLSGSGSAALHAYLERRDQVNKVVNICGRLRPGKETGFRSFERRTASSPGFGESVIQFAGKEYLLTDDDKKKILTVRAFWDELVPEDTTIINGALNIKLNTREHIYTIATALTRYEPVIMFLKGDPGD